MLTPPRAGTDDVPARAGLHRLDGLPRGPHERRELRRALLGTVGHGRGTVLVTGAPGIGKSRLLAEAVTAAHGRSAGARAVDWEAERPFAVLAQLLDEDVLDLDGEDAFAAARRLAERAGDDPTLLVVDDAQWCDRASLQALSTLARHHRGVPAIVLLAADSGRGPSATSELLHSTADVTVSLGPLSSRDIEELCADRGRPLPPWLTERLRRHTEGNPRHVLALLDELPDEVRETPDLRLPPPHAVAARVQEVCRTLGDDARALLEATACFGEPASLDEIARTAGLDDVLGPLGEAAAVGLVRRFGGRSLPVVGLADPMVRAAVLDLVGPDRAARLRRRAAGVVADHQRQLTLVAAATPGPDAELARRLTELAEGSATQGAWSAAADALLEASRLTDDHASRELLLIRAVDAMIGAGAVFEAEAMIPAIENLVDTSIRNSVLGYLAVLLGRTGQAERALDRAWEIADRDGPDGAAWICQRRVLHALCCGDGGALVDWADRAIELVGAGHPAAVEALAMRGLGTAARGLPHEGLGEYRGMRDRVRHGAQAQRVAMGHGWLHLVLGRLDEARAELDSAIPTTALGGSSRISLWASGWLARVHFLGGDWDLALRSVAQGLRLAERTGIVIVTPLLAWTAVQVHALRDDFERAERALRDVDRGADDYQIMAVPRRLARASLAEARADYGAVVRALAPLADEGDTAVVQPGWWPWRDVHANALVLEGHLDEADEFLSPHERRAVDQDNLAEIGRLAWARGRLHAARGDLGPARSAFEHSIATLDALPLRWDRARAHFAYGQSMRRLARRREADTILSTARELFLGLGATAYVGRCDRELRAGGVHQSRPERAGKELTPQEAAVVDLVARGLSNKDAAAELHVSPKTVQYHLTRIFTKLGVRSRAELAGRHRDAAGDRAP